jgi:hypothetical protein
MVNKLFIDPVKYEDKYSDIAIENEEDILSLELENNVK